MTKARSALNKLGRKKWSRFHAAVFALLISLLLSGCMVGPDYTGRSPDAKSGWVAEMEKGLNATRPKKERLSSWWTVFDDATLTELEQMAVSGNLELKTAISRLRQARLSRGISRSDLLPGISAEGRARKQESSESMGTGSGGAVRDYFLAQFDASWELDVFGGIRRSVQAAQAEIEASRANVSDVLISLMSEVALNYFEVRTYQRRIGITRANIRAQKRIHELNVSRYQSGLVEEIAVQQSLRNLESSRSRIPSLESELRAARNRLAVLVGRPPGVLEGLLGTVREVPDVPAEVAVGIPAEAMRRRPDIRRAERRLAAQTARIGAATAELYPKFHLLGSIGLEAVDAQNEAESEFFDSRSGFWNLGPGVSWNIFNGNSVRLNIELQTE
ncbi:MAG: efflux transporter outer membrane subunit, partial [Desulfohalobiaceae bacterium]|nr:efflux transporter outer membrane subunit [Desulfohalobiaceae bacterium]